MVSSNYNLYIESIDSDPKLSSSKYKRVQFNKNTFYDEVLPNFFTGLPSDIAYKVKYDDDNDNMYDSFDKQFDDIYQMGCRNIIDNKNYNEEFECFAPLYLGSDSTPSNFVVFRVDGPGLIKLDKDNFRSEILDNLKCVKVFDLTKKTPLGEWMDKNFLSNDKFPVSPFYMDYRDLEFSSWNGIDYEIGGYTTRSFFLNSTLEYENTFYDFENLLLDGYRNNKIVFPNILNLSFLFDDTPATPDSLRKWSINRYMGFYMDNIELVRNVSPYILPVLRNDVEIRPGNILHSDIDENPFVDDWDSIKSPYVEIDGKFYKVERYSRTGSPGYSKSKLSSLAYSDEITEQKTYYYKIISEVDYKGITYSNIDANLISVDSDLNGYYIYNSVDPNQDLISDYDTADVWLIEIDGKFHVIKKVSNKYYLNTDYGFSLDNEYFSYWINNLDPSYRTSIPLRLTDSINFVPFKIYRCKFTDIKDFDTSIVDTTYSKFEYEKPLTLTNTDESKMYTTDYSGPTNPKDYNDYIIGGKVVNIPCSSEYTANGETFRIQNNDLTPLWRKNPIRVKWGYQNSLSSNDYPYLLNNSFLSEDYNRTSNTFDPVPNRRERNLDYFYSINSSTASYSYHSLHVEDYDNGGINSNFYFDFGRYLTSSSDYFSYFFGKKSYFNYGEEVINTEKFSIFEKGDNVIPNQTLFRGLKFSLYDVSDVKVVDNNIDNINLKTSNKYQGYKFSILLSENSKNNLQWDIINNWSHNTTYATNSVVCYYDILYVANSTNTLTDPNDNPSIRSDIWGATAYSSTSPTKSVLWNPTSTYVNNDYVYNYGEYYYYDSSVGNTYSFWKPFDNYSKDDIVIFNNKKWKSTSDNNIYQPDSSAFWVSNISTTYSTVNLYWIEIDIVIPWKVVELWTPKIIYPASLHYVVYNNILYSSIYQTTSSDVPGISSKWVRVADQCVQSDDTDYVLKTWDLAKINNRYYRCISNSNKETLQNGITVYINKAFKNILINISFDDNTLPYLSNADRDSIYNDMYSTISAFNFMTAINDMSNKYGFSDYLKYVIMDESGNINTYNFNNISTIPCILHCQAPDEFSSRNQSFNIKPVSLETSQFKAKRQLDNGKIVTIDMINYYNGNKLATQIDKVKGDPEIIPNYHGLTNNIYTDLYRHSGYYCPIFYTIPLFEAPKVIGDSISDVGNYKFDTELTNFGIIKERVMSKINRKGNILKLKFNPDIRSIYPMIDEFGYTISDYFMFKSTWDIQYYIECLDIDQTTSVTLLTNKIVKPE